VLTAEQHEGLGHLMTFQFKRHSCYNFPSKRLKLMEKQIQKRARLLLTT
jgi:hypothetical protein